MQTTTFTRLATVAFAVGTVMACGSTDPYGRNVTVPEGSLYAQPAQELVNLGYSILHVDTIIGYIEAYRTRGGPQSEADRMTVDVYKEIRTGNTVVTIVAQSLERMRFINGMREISGRAGPPSLSLRQDAERLQRALGCPDVTTEQRMTPDGIELVVTCDTDTPADSTNGGAPNF